MTPCLPAGKVKNSEHKRLLRLKVIEHHGSACWYCGSALEPQRLTLDHVIPACRGGPRTFTNLVPACFKCNQEKGGMLLEEYRELIHSRTAAGKAQKAISETLAALDTDSSTIRVAFARLGVRWFLRPLIVQSCKQLFPGERSFESQDIRRKDRTGKS